MVLLPGLSGGHRPRTPSAYRLSPEIRGSFWQQPQPPPATNSPVRLTPCTHWRPNQPGPWWPSHGRVDPQASLGRHRVIPVGSLAALGASPGQEAIGQLDRLSFFDKARWGPTTPTASVTSPATHRGAWPQVSDPIFELGPRPRPPAPCPIGTGFREITDAFFAGGKKVFLRRLGESRPLKVRASRLTRARTAGGPEIFSICVFTDGYRG
jgi:hypothetical protein